MIEKCAVEGWSENQLSATQAAFADGDFKEWFRRGLCGDRADMLEQLAVAEPAYLRVLNRKTCLDFYSRMLEVTAGAWAVIIDHQWRVLEEYEERCVYGSELLRKAHRPFNSIAINSAEYASLMAEWDVERHCAVVILAMIRHKKKHGEYPASAAAIDPGILRPKSVEDPFAEGHRLRIVIEPESVTVYSVGEDGTDDAGSIRSADGSESPLDLGLRVLR